MIKRFVYKSEFLKHSVQLITGTVMAQLIPIALQPILRRMFTPEEFGVMAIYFSIVSIVCIVVSMNYQSAVVLPEDDEDAMSLVFGSLALSAVISILFFFVLILFSGPIFGYFNFPSGLQSWIWILPLSVFLNAAHLIFGNWLIREKAFKELSINKVSRRMAEGVVQVGLGWKLKSGGGLIIGTFIGDLINGFTYLFQYFQTGGNFGKAIRKKTKFNLARYKQFPLVSLMPNLLSTVSMFIPVLLIASVYATELTGQFDLSRQILALPLSLISVSVSQVLLKELSDARKNKASVLSKIGKLFFLLLAISVVICVITFFFGEELFSWIFGEEWRFSGKITEILVISYGFKFIVAPLSIAFIAFEKLVLNSIWQICYFLTMFSLYLMPKMEFKDFLYVLIAIDIVMYTIYGLLTYKIILEYEKNKYD